MTEVPPGEGGSPGDVTILFQDEGDQLLGGTQLQRIVEVGCISHPSQTFFQFRLPLRGYTRAAGAAYAGGFSLLIEELVLDPDVTGVAYVQDVNAAGQLLDELEIFFVTPDGTGAGSVTINMNAATSDTARAAIQTAMGPLL